MVSEVQSIHAIEERNREKAEKKLRQKIRPYELMEMREKYIYNGIRKIAYLDIESSGLTADFDIMLSYAMVIRDIMTEKTELKYGVLNKNDFKIAIKKGDADLIDKRLVLKLLEDAKDSQLWVGHWFVGKHRHDVPFIRTRCMMNGLLDILPPHKKIRYGDTQKLYSQGFQLHSYGLKSIASALGIPLQKTDVPPKTWKAACLGSKVALDYVLDHNIRDAKIELLVHKAVERFVPIPSTYY